MACEQATTTDLSDFGWREKKMAAELLTAMTEQGLPDDFEDDGVTVMMNMYSGNVFLTNAEYQVAMLNEENLESWYYCPECGYEGFKDDVAENGSSCCRKYLREVGVLS